MADANTVTAIGTVLAAVAAVGAVYVAHKQLGELAAGSRLNALMGALQLEAEINDRREAMDKTAFDVREEGGNTKLQRDRMDTSLQNYFNAVDRLAFCILRNYFPEKDWRAEYRDYMSNCIDLKPDWFGANTKYRNIVDLNARWKRA